MNTTEKLIQAGVEANPLQVLVLYDDIAVGKQAKLLCDCVAHGLAQKFTLHPTFWSFASLELSELLHLVAGMARSASFIVVAVDGQTQLPPAVKTLVNLFCQTGCLPECAVVALLNLPAGFKESASAVHHFLQQSARAGGLRFFCEVIERPKTPRNIRVERAGCYWRPSRILATAHHPARGLCRRPGGR